MFAVVPGLLLAVSVLGAADARGVVVEVEAGKHDRRATTVTLPWPDSLPGGVGAVLETLDGTPPVEAQVLPSGKPTVAWVVRNLPAGSRRRYRLRAGGERAPAGADVTCSDDGKDLSVGVGGRPVLRYNHAVDEPPAGLDPVYRRGGYIHPLSTPSGLTVTDDFAPDHAHQHGLFFAWVDTRFRGHKVDFWNQPQRTGRVRHVATASTFGGPALGGFTVRLRHEDVSQPGEPVAALDEVWTVRVHADAAPYLVDFGTVQTCAGTDPLDVLRYHYGGLGLRGNRAWLDPRAGGEEPPDPSRSGESGFLTSEAKGRNDGNHTRPRWVDLSGAVGGRVGGVTVLGHPANFRSPEPVRLHPNKPYFSVSPPVAGRFAVAPGSPFVANYRLVLHDGKPDPAETERLWLDFADPPRVRVVEEP